MKAEDLLKVLQTTAEKNGGKFTLIGKDVVVKLIIKESLPEKRRAKYEMCSGCAITGKLNNFSNCRYFKPYNRKGIVACHNYKR